MRTLELNWQEPVFSLLKWEVVGIKGGKATLIHIVIMG
jgi:hypothetical protein